MKIRHQNKDAARGTGVWAGYDALVERGRSVAFLWSLKLLLRIATAKCASVLKHLQGEGGGGGGGWGGRIKKHRGKMPEAQLNTDNKNLGELFLIVASGICVEGPGKSKYMSSLPQGNILQRAQRG